MDNSVLGAILRADGATEDEADAICARAHRGRVAHARALADAGRRADALAGTGYYTVSAPPGPISDNLIDALAHAARAISAASAALSRTAAQSARPGPNTPPGAAPPPVARRTALGAAILPAGD